MANTASIKNSENESQIFTPIQSTIGTEEEKTEKLINNLKQSIRLYLSSRGTEEESQLLEHAFEDIAKYHASQKRLSGQPYIVHPLRVSWSICQAGLDPQTVIGSLLHDAIEDTSITKEYISERYGEWYADVVDGLTKIKYPKDSKGKQVANLEATYQKMLVAMVRDVRSLLIKLFDRLDNMQDLDALPRHKQRRISWETLGVYVPMARRFGLEKISEEHTELCFKYLYPRRYKNTVQEIGRLKKERWSTIVNMGEVLQSLLDSRQLINTKVEPILETVASHIYRKDSIDKILKGFRILVDNVMSSYHVLGILHTGFRAIPLKIRDFVSNPRWNGYQGLQTEIILEGELVWVEILSKEMHDLNQYGIMAHWTGSPTELAEYYRNYLDQLDQVAGEKDLRMDDILRYAQSEQVQVFTPKGDILTFPKDATILDAAYHIHTDLGNTCVGALVNTSTYVQVDQARNKRVPRDRKLFNGERIEILTDLHVEPAKEWLEYVVTAKAKIQIKRALNIQKAIRARKVGKDLLYQELQKLGEDPEILLESEEFKQALEKEKVTENKFLEELGLRKRVIRQFLKDYQLVDAQKINGRIRKERMFLLKPWENLFGNSGDSAELLIDDLDDILIHFSECCSPIPGDKIVGFSNENHEVEVHRALCPVAQQMKDVFPISVGWNIPSDDIRSYELQLITEDAQGTLYKISKIIKEAGVGIEDSKSSRVNEEAHFILKLEPIPWRVYHRIVERLRVLKVVKKIW